MSDCRVARGANAVAVLALAASLEAVAFDQPEVRFLVERWSDGRIAECPRMVGSLGDSMEVVLGNRMRIAARAAVQDAEGRSEITLAIHSPSGALAHEFRQSARLAQQRPSFQYTIPEPKGGLNVMVESPSLLGTTREKPSWRDFDTRARSHGTSNESRSPRECVPLLGAPQRVR